MVGGGGGLASARTYDNDSRYALFDLFQYKTTSGTLYLILNYIQFKLRMEVCVYTSLHCGVVETVLVRYNQYLPIRPSIILSVPTTYCPSISRV